MFSSSSYHPLLILTETQSVSCISLNFLTLISENFWILLAVWWLWNLRIPPKWQAGNKNVRACETPPWLAALLYHHSHQGCTLLSFSTWVCMCSESSCGKMQTKLTNWSLWMNHKKKTHSLANELTNCSLPVWLNAVWQKKCRSLSSDTWPSADFGCCDL